MYTGAHDFFPLFISSIPSHEPPLEGRTAVHSISTSVLRGRVLTATHLYIMLASGPKSRDLGDSRPAGLNITPVLHVNLIHGSKVVHVGQKDVDLDNMVDSGASSLENGSQVLDALVLHMN